MLSRVAESVYWMNRYMERAENIARYVDVNLLLLLDLPELFEGQWEALVKITGQADEFHSKYGDANEESVIRFLAFDSENENSIVSCVTAARENARSVREIISTETWEEVNEFYLSLRDPRSVQRASEDPHRFCRRVKRSGLAFSGIINETMSRDEGWHFSRLGRLLERADKTTRILDLKYFLLLPNAQDVGTSIDDVHWAAILRSSDAFMMYRKAHGRLVADRIIQFLILDPRFPRSIRYCLTEVETSLHAITGSPARTFQNPAERRLGQLTSELDYTDHRDVVLSGLHQFVDSFQLQLNEVGDCIFESFFGSAKPSA